MKLIIPIIIVLTCAVAADFPEDPSGVDVIDRAFERIFYEGEQLALYFTLFNSEGRGTVKIDEFRYGEWETVYIWNPRGLDDEFMVFNPISMLSIYGHEGLVSFYLKFNFTLDEWQANSKSQGRRVFG